MYCPGHREYEQKVNDGAQIIPVYADVLLDTESPISVYLKLCQDKQGYLLESVGGGEHVGRYSFIGYEPFVQVELKDGVTYVRFLHQTKPVTKALRGDPFDALKDLLAQYRVDHSQDLPPLFGGLVGYLSYDLVRYIENLPCPPPADLDLPDLMLMACRKIIVFDHVTRWGKIVVNVVAENGKLPSYGDAVAEVDAVIDQLRNPGGKSPVTDQVRKTSSSPLTLDFNVSQSDFMASVKRAQQYITQGDVFQVVLSQRAETPLTVHPLSLYRILRAVNPSPYLFYINFGQLQLAGSSPEMLVRMQDNVVESKPLAGTRRRSGQPDTDRMLEQELLADVKERAEHVMLVDLSRNDLGKVCEYGSIQLPSFMEVERFSHVMHLVSRAVGQVKPQLDAVDVFKACFPAGTLTGAPKVRAMEIIDELETCRRGPYGGAVGYFSFSGNLDTCITIRTALIYGGKVYVQAGAGVVFDSDAEKEYQECLHKAQALFMALERAEEVENRA